MAHELLRQAALILAAGWSKGADARDATGRIVPLYVGAAFINLDLNARDLASQRHIPRMRAPILMRTP
jgi:hypothetical protein